MNKKKNSCSITNLWASVEAMREDIFIDLDKQEVTSLLSGNKLKKFLSTNKRKKEKNYYRVSFSKNKKNYTFLLHRLLFYWHHGYLPKLVDHKDTNSQNNKIENLRQLNSSGNKRNSKKKENCTSKYKGVYWHKKHKKWVAQLCLNYKINHIGYFDNEDDAGQAYNDKIRELGLEEISVMNDTPQERARKNNLFDPLPPEMNHIKDLFKNLNPLDFGNLK
jgi:hypothetical protein